MQLLNNNFMYYRVSLLRCTDPGKCQNSLSLVLLALTFFKKQLIHRLKQKQNERSELFLCRAYQVSNAKLDIFTYHLMKANVRTSK